MHPDPTLLIKYSLFQSFQDFQEDFFELHDLIIKWLEKYYLERSISNNRFRPFPMLAKKDDTEEGAFTRIFRGFSYYAFHQKGKNVDWLEVVGVTHFSAHKKYLFVVQVLQASIFSLAHYFISSLIVHIFVDAGQEKLRWLHWKLQYT